MFTGGGAMQARLHAYRLRPRVVVAEACVRYGCRKELVVDRASLPRVGTRSRIRKLQNKAAVVFVAQGSGSFGLEYGRDIHE